MIEGGSISGSTENPNFAYPVSLSGQPLALDEEGNVDAKDQYVMILGIKSPIYKYNQECGPRGTQSMMRSLAEYQNDPQVAGVVLDIDSGGGQVSGTAEFYDYLRNYKKPVVTYTGGYMCSAAYYIGSAADEVIASNRADSIGSIGTMIEYLDMTGFYEKKGAKLISAYADKSTAKNKAIRAAREGDLSLLIKEELNPITETFHNDMKAARPGLNEEVLAGATYGAEKSVVLGLVDRIGTLQDAVDAVFTLSRKRDTTSNQFNSNINTTMKTTDRPLLQAAMGLDGALASLEDHSSLSNEQLDTIEAHLATQADAVTTAADQVTAAQTATTDAQATVTDMTASLDALISVNGLEVAADATQEQKFTAVQGHITTLGARKAANPTVTRVDANETQTSNGIIDASAAHNQIADNL